MQFTTLTNLLVMISALAATTAALPVSAEKRDVFVPPLLYPKAGTVWQANSKHNITWDVSNPPKQITNSRGRLLLRRGGINTGLILADNFDILTGRLEITVPWVVDGDEYSLILFGDSGNVGPDFTIHSGIQG